MCMCMYDKMHAPEERHVALAEGQHGDELPHGDRAALRGAGGSGGELEAEVLLCILSFGVWV